MESNTDCLFIGNNEPIFEQQEKMVKSLGKDSEAYRDLNLNFVIYNDNSYTPNALFNQLYYTESSIQQRPITGGETFSAGIAYLGTYLNRRGYKFDFINSFQDDKDELREKLQKNNYRTIVLLTTLYISSHPIIEIIEFIKKYNTQSKIIVGGPYIYNHYRKLDSNTLQYIFNSIRADYYVISNQGEKTLENLLSAITKGKPIDEIPNLVHFKNGEYKINKLEAENVPLNDNMVNWELFQNKLGDYVNLRTCLGCAFKCSFCSFHDYSGRFEPADVCSVIQELNTLKKCTKVTNITFVDDTFNVPVKRFKQLLREMINKKYNYSWISHFRCQYADEEMVKLMKESGCEGVFLGLESADDSMLKRMNKNVTVNQFLKGIELLKKYDIMIFGSFFYGFPGETESSVRKTIDFIETNALDLYRVQLWYCEPNTPIWREKEKYNVQGEGFNWEHNTMNSKTASDFVEETFLTVNNSTFLSQYNFDLENILYMMNRGLTRHQSLEFLRIFNNAVKDKLKKDNYSLDDLKLNELRSVLFGNSAQKDEIKANDIMIDFNL